MKKFKVWVREILYHDYFYEVEAKNEEEAENRYFDGVCVKETENGKEESGGEEPIKVEEIIK